MASFYVRKSGASGWIAVMQEYENGKKKQRALKAEEYRVHSLNRNWSVEEARQQIGRLNKFNKVQTLAKSRAARRASLSAVHATLYIDDALTIQFQKYLVEDVLAGDETRAETNKIFSHWKVAQKIINKLQLLPQQYGKHTGKFAGEFKKRSISPDYCIKLIKVINHYGDFCCQHLDQYYRPIKLNRFQIQQIRDQYSSAKSYRGPSKLLTPQQLESKKAQLSEENYRWLYISVWLGLRPSEINQIQHPELGYKIEEDKKRKVRFVHIYQSKLKSISSDKRWKFIPLLFKEQKLVESYLALPLKQPTNKTLTNLFGPSVRGYAGRKSFTDLMLEKGRQLEEISSWLGHTTIETTWKFYKAKDKLTLLAKPRSA